MEDVCTETSKSLEFYAQKHNTNRKTCNLDKLISAGDISDTTILERRRDSWMGNTPLASPQLPGTQPDLDVRLP